MSNKVKIGSFCKVRRGASPRPIDNPNYFGGDVGWIRISDVTKSFKYLNKTEQYVSPLGESLSVRVDKGDLVMSICGTIGRPIIINIPSCIHDGFVQLYDIKEANKEYLYYILQHHEKDLERKGQPGTQVNLNTTIVENFEIYFPAKPVQSNIARILSTADAVIEKTQAAIAKYKAIKQGMLQDLFTRGIDLKTNKLRPRYEESPELYKESKLGMIPREWYVRELESVCDVRDGTHDSPAYHDKGIPFITSKNLKETGIDFTDINYISKENHIQFSQRSKVENGDILFAMIGTVGNPVIVNANFEFSIKNVALLKFEQSKDLINTYSLQFLKSNQISEQFGRKSEGSVQSFISLTTIRSLLFPIPNLNEQNAIAERFLSIDTTLQTEQSYLQKMQSLKKGLMEDLLSGKKQVKVSEPLIVTD